MKIIAQIKNPKSGKTEVEVFESTEDLCGAMDRWLQLGLEITVSMGTAYDLIITK